MKAADQLRALADDVEAGKKACVTVFTWGDLKAKRESLYYVNPDLGDDEFERLTQQIEAFEKRLRPDA